MTRLPTTPVELVDFCISRAMAVNSGPDLILCRILGCKPFYVPALDRSMNPHLVTAGVWEAPLTCFLARLVQPGWKWCDIGANVGYFSVLLSELTSDAKGLSYEPNPNIHSILLENLRVNGCLNSHGVQAAIGTHYTQFCKFSRSSTSTGGASMYVSPYVDGETEGFLAELLTLATPWEFDLVKIDAEGEDLLIVLSWVDVPKHTVIEYAGKFSHVPGLLPALFNKCRVQLIDEQGNARDTTVDEVKPLDVATLYLQPR